jgi:hypothetical protein
MSSWSYVVIVESSAVRIPDTCVDYKVLLLYVEAWFRMPDKHNFRRDRRQMVLSSFRFHRRFLTPDRFRLHLAY